MKYWIDTIKSDIMEIQTSISAIPNRSDDLDRSIALNHIEKKLRDAKSYCSNLKIDIRLVRDPKDSIPYKKELLSYEQTLAQLSTEIQALKPDACSSPKLVDPVQAGDVLLDSADKIQDKAHASLANTSAMIAEMKSVAITTLEDLEKQRNQINNMDQDVISLQGNLVRSDKMIRKFRLLNCFRKKRKIVS
jgi:hypothetical protein